MRKQLNKLARRAISGTEYVTPHWIGVPSEHSIDEFVASLGPSNLDAVEVSGGPRPQFGWKSFTVLEYPEFDLLAPEHDETYDVVFAQNVLEHVRDPWRAAQSLHDLCRPGGHVVVSTPFMIKIHKCPDDYWRFTPDGLRELMTSAGLEVLDVHSWGNAWAVALNARVFVAERRWVHWMRRWTMHNNPATPVDVWVFARRPQ